MFGEEMKYDRTNYIHLKLMGLCVFERHLSKFVCYATTTECQWNLCME